MRKEGDAEMNPGGTIPDPSKYLTSADEASNPPVRAAKPLLFSSPEEAATYLLLAGFAIEGQEISWHGFTPCTHRILYAIDWLTSKHGYTYAGRREPAPCQG